MKRNAIRCSSALLLFLTAIFVNTGCQRPGSATMDYMTIDFTTPDATISVDLEEIADHFQMIRLETKDECLIGHFWGYVGQNHIIYIGNDHLLHFSSDGTFIRKIIQKGRGPVEFSRISAWDVDAEENFFIFYDNGKDYLYKYDLNRAEFASSILYDQQIPLDDLQIINDTLLAFLPQQFSDFGYHYFMQSTNGYTLNGPKRKTVEQSGPWAGISALFKKITSDSIIFSPNSSDTIYLINNETMTPYMLPILEKKQISGNTTKGEYTEYIYETRKNMLFYKNKFEQEVGSSYVNMSINHGPLVIIDKDELRLFEISELKSDYMGLGLGYIHLRTSQNGRFYFAMTATSTMDRIDNALKINSVPDSQLETIKKLQTSLTENDNPIIITGVFKDDLSLSMVQ